MPKQAVSPIIRTTYALDAATVARLDRMAKAWNLTRSATLRRLISETPDPVADAAGDPRLIALRELQQRHQLTAEQKKRWKRDILAQRRKQTQKILRRWKGARSG